MTSRQRGRLVARAGARGLCVAAVLRPLLFAPPVRIGARRGPFEPLRAVKAAAGSDVNRVVVGPAGVRRYCDDVRAQWGDAVVTPTPHRA